MAKDNHPQRGGEATPRGQAGQSRVISLLQSILGIGLIIVVVVNIVNSLSRYLLGVSPVGMDELMVYIVIWLVMLGAFVSLIKRSHINMNLLPLYARGRFAHLLNVIQDLAGLFASLYAAWAAWLFIPRIARLGVKSMGMGLPMTVPHAALLVGFAAMALVAAVFLIKDSIALIQNRPLPTPANDEYLS